MDIPIKTETGTQRIRNTSGDIFTAAEEASIQARLQAELEARAAKAAAAKKPVLKPITTPVIQPPKLKPRSEGTAAAVKPGFSPPPGTFIESIRPKGSPKTGGSARPGGLDEIRLPARSAVNHFPPKATVKSDQTLTATVARTGDGLMFNRDELTRLVAESRKAAETISIPPPSPVKKWTEENWKDAGPNAWRYSGMLKDGAMNGRGKLTCRDGWEYVGDWRDGLMHGSGTLKFPDGSFYEGNWENGRMHGEGTLVYPDGWQFVGQWANGKILGEGVLVHPGN